ncbi:sensor domain-containing diguanylate cyclase [Trichlorobacter ammonificans]|uniref:diguanylate cyclase n=1 Tax=Trichlorobacter ammonificans TaxID=2916410 RepID=A0ABM9DE27_9BACT|nr:GGDEF domain-containing protein [Trichlorobacter ammonificans]CAH2032656.1 diguanylate cyclase (GGDEF domain) with PAS/PAC sensor [Trichlorobacter ammonificans]
MNSEYRQIFDTTNQGLVVLDRNLTVTDWNRWMEMHSSIRADEIIGRPLFDFYPSLQHKQAFTRAVKCAFSFGSFGYFSQKLHHYLFPMRNPHAGIELFPRMQQHCTLGPLRDESGQINSLFIAVQDVTEFVLYEHRLIEMTRVDSLTGLYNRRFLTQRLEEELERSRRHGNPLCLMLMDVDHFKQINDSRGHLCGDQVLRSLAQTLRDMFRKSDILGRFGGEEFVCILPETTLEKACILTERCRTSIADIELFYQNTPFAITISAGVTELTVNDSADSLIRRADNAMYQAKQAGRNRCICTPPPPPSP